MHVRTFSRFFLSATLRSVPEPAKKARSTRRGQALDWSLFWELLRPDVFLLGAAVVAALTVAYVNIQIPILLGSVRHKRACLGLLLLLL